MSVDNFELIKSLLKFEDPLDCYFVMVIKRKKDGNPDAKGDHKDRIIRHYFIRSVEHLNSKEQEIKKLCEFFNARAVINLNRRNLKKLALSLMKELADCIFSEDYFRLNSILTTTAGRYKAESEKKFLIDIDSENLHLKQAIINVLSQINPPVEKLIAEIPSKNGVHIIARAFDLLEFRKRFPFIDVHKDNPTNLYIPF